MMEVTLNKLGKTSADFAERMFQNLRECISENTIRVSWHKEVSCHGIMEFKMRLSDFEDVRMFINAVNELLIESE
ncbi:MAG TPA: hypothetical protein VHY08_01610 [Bacillota bacterium]|nr:hypothetical protein [Bacillota bacterium]